MDNESLKRAMEREIALACDEEEKKEREKEGERKALKDCVAFKYPKNDLNWIDDCNEIQCQMIKELLFQDLSYEQFYESIQKYIEQTLSILAKTMGRKRKTFISVCFKILSKE